MQHGLCAVCLLISRLHNAIHQALQPTEHCKDMTSHDATKVIQHKCESRENCRKMTEARAASGPSAALPTARRPLAIRQRNEHADGALPARHNSTTRSTLLPANMNVNVIEHAAYSCINARLCESALVPATELHTAHAAYAHTRARTLYSSHAP